MKISRREFVGGTAVSASGLCLLGPREFRRVASRAVSDCVVLDLGADCVLRESLEGYRAALGEEHACDTVPGMAQLGPCRMVIVPGAGCMDSAAASKLLDLLNEGSDVLLESGAGFLRPSDFAAHQELLRKYFGVDVLPPLNVWTSDRDFIASRSVPYVSYTWPRKAMVRDFSCVVPASAPEDDVIGRMGKLPLALKKRVANGLLVFIGSPLGPALGAGDPDAQQWLRSISSRYLQTNMERRESINSLRG
jgi:hypothetical protein